MKNLKRILPTVLLSLLSFAASAQEVEMADGMRANGKIYVVVSIILIVLTGLIFYLVLLDRKVKKLTQLVADKNQVNKP